MRKPTFVIGKLLSAIWILSAMTATAFADSTDWRMTPVSPPLSDKQKHAIGLALCGESGFEATGTGLRCGICPGFTGNAGSNEGLEIESWISGRFTSASAGDELLLDTEGCEAHFESFGGAILMSPVGVKPGLRNPGSALGANLASRGRAGPLRRVFYKPGFRINDCLSFDGDKVRTLLVCNEADMAQGEVIGHISAMDITRRGIVRWRLLRWYDDSASQQPGAVSVTPVSLRKLVFDGGQSGLQIQLRVSQSTGEPGGAGRSATHKTVELLFRRQVQRFFATLDSQRRLEELAGITGKAVE